jgi:hypothetical protein
MDRRAAAMVAAIVLLSLAGCSALPVWDDGQPEPTATPTTTPAPTPTPEDLTSADYPDGYGPEGVEDPEAAVASHVRTLTGYESYRFRFDVGVGSGNGTEDAFVYLVRVDRADRQAVEIRDEGDVTQRQYYEEDRLYLRRDVDDETTYNATDLGFDGERLTGEQFVAPLIQNVEYGRPTRVETDNGTIYRYTSENVTDPGAILPADTTGGEIADFTVELLVHEDGYVRGARYVVITEDGTELGAVGVVDEVDEVDVTRPDWYDRAAEE